MAKIIIPTPLRKFTGNTGVFETSGTTVKEAIQQLTEVHSGLSRHLLDDNRKIRSFIRVYLGEDDINSLNKDETAITSDSVISIVPAIAGGC